MDRGKRQPRPFDAQRLERAKEELLALAGIKDMNERLWEAAAIIQRELEVAGVSSVLVGGLAVSYWTDGHHTTSDIDVLMATSEDATEVLAGLGLVRLGRSWELDELGLAFEAPGWVPDEKEDVDEVTTPAGRPLKILSIEDIAIWRLKEFVAWESSEGFHHTLYLLESPFLDRNRLDKRAAEEGLTEAVAILQGAFAEQKKRDKPFEQWELHELARHVREGYSQQDG
jgi:hypothetical protein